MNNQQHGSGDGSQNGAILAHHDGFAAGLIGTSPTPPKAPSPPAPPVGHVRGAGFDALYEAEWPIAYVEGFKHKPVPAPAAK